MGMELVEEKIEPPLSAAYLLTCLLLLLLPAALPAQVKIGVIAPLTGSSANFGNQVRTGIVEAVESPFSLVMEDSRSDSKTALGAYRKLTLIDGVTYLISVGGETCEVINRAAQRDGLIHIAVGCNTASFKEPKSYNFRLDVNEATAAEKTCQFLLKKRAERVALFSIENNWGGTVAKFAAEAMQRARLEVTDHITFTEASMGDLRSSLLRVKASRPDYLFVVTSPETLAVLLRQLKDLGISVPIISTIAVENPAVPRLAGSLADGIVYLSVKEEPLSRSRYRNFFERHGAAATYSAWGHDAVLLLKNAHEAGSPVDYLRGLSRFLGAFNIYNYDEHGELHLEYEMRRIESGEFVFDSDA